MAINVGKIMKVCDTTDLQTGISKKELIDRFKDQTVHTRQPDRIRNDLRALRRLPADRLYSPAWITCVGVSHIPRHCMIYHAFQKRYYFVEPLLALSTIVWIRYEK